jgi:hypothetical protein
MPQDALASFRSLLEQVPGWITGLESILDNATKRQNDLLFVNQPADSDRTLVRKASKSSSLKSKRSRKEQQLEASVATDISRLQTPTTPTPIPTLLLPQLPHMTESDALRLSQRKRKTFSACSGDMSGPSKYRSRALVVVYYDGDIQKSLTRIVQDFSSCRNDIRKSKMAAKVDMLSRSGSSSSGSDSSAGEETVKGIGSFAYRTTRLRPQDSSPMSKPDGSEALEKVDGLLEKSQNLCEHAAHQVLRDGDCASELSQVKKLLEEAKSSAELELPSLERLAAEAEERQRRVEARQRLERSRQPPPQPADSEKIELLSRQPSHDPFEVDEIEVDDEDDDDSDEEFEMAALKLRSNMTKYSMGSARMTAAAY